MPRFDVTTFGEGGLRLSVPLGNRLEAVTKFDVHVAGAEGNVTGALSRLGWQCGWVSGLPDTPMGQRVAQAYRSAGIDLSGVVWRNDSRLSVYYVEYATPPRPTRVYFDRKESCINQLTIADIDWDYLLDTRIIHLTGITVPLSSNCESIVMETLQRAKQMGVTVSFDVNYRHLLWTPEQANGIIQRILPHVDILFCSQKDAQIIFGYSRDAETTLKSLKDESHISKIVMSVAADGVIACNGDTLHHIPAKSVGIVDRIGAGDGLVAGVLHGWLQDDFIKGLNYGVTMSALAMSQFGDMVITTYDELETLLSSNLPDITR